MGSDDTVNPEYQVGNGCLADQLIGQYLADVVGLGPLVSPVNVRKTLASLYRYNYHRTLVNHDTVQRTYALNDEAALVICDYGKAQRPLHPVSPYYAEAWTGIEYLVGSTYDVRGKWFAKEWSSISTFVSGMTGRSAIPGMNPNAVIITRGRCRRGAAFWP